ncbi:hypothetical protein CEXT_8501 [Caerostris extrusa]|uniref:Uncharacterized protein n=1 Tax=Caerostris extrusa TaxID=172846 RepID=A0AAV4NFH3_CAEEX|nr:hypothetical protein CEXT_8501 [Caerostris extrusa]
MLRAFYFIHRLIINRTHLWLHLLADFKTEIGWLPNAPQHRLSTRHLRSNHGGLPGSQLLINGIVKQLEYTCADPVVDQIK